MNHTPFRLARYFAAHEFTAKHLLCSSDPESISVKALLALEPGSEHGLQDTWLGYTEYPGAPRCVANWRNTTKRSIRIKSSCTRAPKKRFIRS